MGWQSLLHGKMNFNLFVELHGEGSAPATCAAGLFYNIFFFLAKVVKVVGGGSLIIGAYPVYFIWYVPANQ